MYATNSSRGEYFDPGGPREHQRSCNRRCAIRPLRHRDAEVSARDFSHTLPAEKTLEVRAGKSEHRTSARDRTYRSGRSVCANRVQHALGRVTVCRDWQALRQNRALQGNDRGTAL